MINKKIKKSYSLPENHRAVYLTRGHIQSFSRTIYYLIYGLHRKVEGHKF